MKKEDIRRQVKAQKTLLDEMEKIRAAESVFAMLEKTAAFIMADNILMYHSLPDELSTQRFIDKWSATKNFFLPRVNGINLEILPYNRATLKLGAFQIEEPSGDNVCDINDIELILVPGIGYDSNGNRVGRGKGYYDRLLTSTRATKIGVGYDFQVVDNIETDPHDVRVDIVITDKYYYHTTSRRKIRHH